jgi:hypothetical protein
MYYTGINPLTMKNVYVATDYHEKQLQRALLQFNRPQNADLVREALTRAGRTDLIGYGKDCLVRPANDSHQVGKPNARNDGRGFSKKKEASNRKGGKNQKAPALRQRASAAKTGTQRKSTKGRR